jgi:hypothetical protein
MAMMAMTTSSSIKVKKRVFIIPCLSIVPKHMAFSANRDFCENSIVGAT